MEKRCHALEKMNNDLKNKIDELSQLYEVSQRELKLKIQELHKMSLEYEKVRDQRDALARENKKLIGKENYRSYFDALFSNLIP